MKPTKGFKPKIMDFASDEANYLEDPYFIHVSPKSQLTLKTVHSNKKTLEDHIDIITEQNIMVSEGAIGAYVRATKKAEDEGLLSKLWRIGTGKLRNRLGRERTTTQAFGVDFSGVRTTVRETHSWNGTDYEIAVNLDEDKSASREYKLPWASKPLGESPTKSVRRDALTSFVDSMSKMYGKLGMTPGKLAFYTSKEADPRKDPELGEAADLSVKKYKKNNVKVWELQYTPKENVTGFTKKKKSEERKRKREIDTSSIDYSSPKSVQDIIDKYLKGQQATTATLSEKICDHYHIINSEGKSKVNTNILLIGPSGSGKSYAAEICADIMERPFYETSMENKTETGYVGGSVSEILEGLIEKAGSIEKAEKGVVFLDEIDKIRIDPNSNGHTDESVQNELLRVLGGSSIDTKYGQIDTSSIMFICAGAFEELRKPKDDAVGFNQGEQGGNEYNITKQDLIKYGIKRELAGRLKNICYLNRLGEEALYGMLTNPEDSLVKDYTLLFKRYGINLEFQEPALRVMARIAYGENTGGRALEDVMEASLTGLRNKEHQSVQEGKLTITDIMVRKQWEQKYKSGDIVDNLAA
jgi:ATP-dependent Clp protease ATP-binding subunit ClpX